MPLCIGIDVGFSQERATLGIACNREVLPNAANILHHHTPDNDGGFWYTEMTLTAAVSWLSELRDDNQLQGAIIVLDGPIAREKPPTLHREVDAQCMRGHFRRRCPAQAVTAGNGPTYVVATYLLAFAATGSLSGDSYRMNTNVNNDITTANLFETHPTIGMALCLPIVEDTNILPTRQNAVIHPETQIRCAAKSDWYWYDGAKDRVAQVLGIPQLQDAEAIEQVGLAAHEIPAGLFCLAVGVQLAGEAADGTPAYTIGDPDSGVYHLLGPHHETWAADVEQVRVVPLVQGEAPADANVHGENENAEQLCLCCEHGTPENGPRVCPICQHVFQGIGWEGIDQHWRFNHEDVVVYEEFRDTLCQAHR